MIMRLDSGAGMALVRALLFLRQEGEVLLHAAADLEGLCRKSRDRAGGERKPVHKYGTFGLL